MPPAREYITIEEEESQAMLMRADDAREEVGMFELEDDAPDMAQGMAQDLSNNSFISVFLSAPYELEVDGTS